ncbi:hypothetical protein CDD83_6136 [Cordyceps sp. RAO-2017]|nr:hypothetical protein CDD83_6136 [Cordyceps sp. RAO-2017]
MDRRASPQTSSGDGFELPAPERPGLSSESETRRRCPASPLSALPAVSLHQGCRSVAVLLGEVCTDAQCVPVLSGSRFLDGRPGYESTLPSAARWGKSDASREGPREGARKTKCRARVALANAILPLGDVEMPGDVKLRSLQRWESRAM